MRAIVLSLLALAGCARLFGIEHVDIQADASIDAPPPTTWKTGAAGSSHSCAIRDADGALACWGRNELGQLGLGAAAAPERDTPAIVAPGPWTEVTAAFDHTCALDATGAVWCWGDDYQRVVGQGSPTAPLAVPAPFRVPGKYSAVRTGLYQTCAIGDPDGAVWCWGTEVKAQFGGGGSLFAPAVVASGPFRALAVGRAHICAIARDGDNLFCWGANDYGEVGNGTPTGTGVATPAQVPGAWKQIAAAGSYTCAIDATQALQCWGNNSTGELGDMTVNARAFPAPVMGAPAGAAWASVELGDDFACGHTTDGRTWCWGDNRYAQLANPDIAPIITRTYATEVRAGAFDAGFAGTEHVCLFAHGTHALACAGLGGSGALGDGALGTRLLPVRIASDIAQVDAGGHTACSVSTSGALACWGLNYRGVLGDGTDDGNLLDRQVPTRVANPTGQAWSQVSVGTHACALDAASTVYCWGENDHYELGIAATTTDQPAPATSVGMGWASVSAGDAHSCGVDTGDKLWCWGANPNGEGGQDPTLHPTIAPYLQVPGVWKGVAAGSNFTCALDSNRAVECFGYNGLAELGDNTNAPRSAPMLALPATSASALATGIYSSCAVTDARAMACWGYNPNGQIGDGTTQTRPTLFTIPLPAAWSAVSVGRDHACGVAADGGLWCWGGNTYGQLGTGDFLEHHDPVRVGTDTDWVAVAAAYTTSCALKADHSLWCWGDERNGNVGDGAGWRAALVTVP